MVNYKSSVMSAPLETVTYLQLPLYVASNDILFADRDDSLAQSTSDCAFRAERLISLRIDAIVGLRTFSYLGKTLGLFSREIGHLGSL